MGSGAARVGREGDRAQDAQDAQHVEHDAVDPARRAAPAAPAMAASILHLQRTAGNRTVSRMLSDRAGGTIRRQDGTDVLEKGADGSKTIYLDDTGVGHDAPDPSKAPPVLYMDPGGVGHKEPDKSKAPAVLHVDAGGVGHKTPDPTAALPKVLHMD